ncbi:hypothetical protein [Micromonospora sp. WMMD714]|uniref:hypothetical protein n=1 Tax=Micromonospora sp. WMMD714 TaxID=3016097 RepID=UPI00249BD77E|nr:hypothetical protein [Micromonospora sp. WMMD714]WFE65799.1 hypothetical protein O7625_22070 [Micromonospora sp. WMMD714]
MPDLPPQFAVLVVDAARTAVTRYAPEELEVFDTVAVDWRTGGARPARTSRAPGSAVGFGIDTSLVSELFLQAVAAASSEVLVLGATGIGAGIRAGWRRRRRRADPTPPAGSGSTPAADGPADHPASAAPQPDTAPPAARQAVDAPPAVRQADAAAPTPTEPLELTAEQAARLRAACRRHALALGLTPEAADLLADAAVGATVTSDDR